MTNYEKIKKYAIEAEEEITESIKECFVEAYKSKHLGSGFKCSVEIDEDSYWVTGILTKDSQSQSCFNGESFVIYSCDCNFDTDLEGTDDEILDYMLQDFNAFEIYSRGIEDLENLIAAAIYNRD